MKSLNQQMQEAKKAIEEAIAEEKKRVFPIEKRGTFESIRPILDLHILQDVRAGLSAIKYREIWIEWGFKSGHSVMLFEGPPGVGKTTTARWCAKYLDMAFMSLSMGDVGGGDPGETERHLKEAFAAAEKQKAVILLDECDAILWNRAKAGADSMWAIGVINCILMLIEQYPYLIILSTNFEAILDPALQRRLTFRVHFSKPTEKVRRKLWASKWPQWPLRITDQIICKLAKYNLTGADIETAIEQEARYAIIEERKPSATSLEACAKKLQG